jgi:hypothetical protein
MSTTQPDSLSDDILVWDELVSMGPVKRGRSLKWPIARYIRKDSPLTAAEEQFQHGFAAPRHQTRFPITPPVDWGANPYKSKEWRNRLMWLQPLDVYFHAYEVTGDRVWLFRLTELFLDWCRFHHNMTKVAYGTWGDMNVGFRALKLAYIVDAAVSGHWTPRQQDIQLLVWAIDTHTEVLLREEELSEGNHGIFQLNGLKVLSSVAWNNRHVHLVSDYIKKHQRRLLENQFSEEGVHLEHSAKYHWWMARQLKDLVDSGWYEPDEVEWSKHILLMAEEIKIWMTAPDGTPILSGDSKDRDPSASATSAVEVPSYKNPQYRFKWLPKSGYASCKSSEGLLFFSAAYHSKAHKHSDSLHFDLYDQSVPITIDCGSCNNDPGAIRSYQVGTSSHNTIQVDEENFPYRGEDVFGSALKQASCHEFGVILTGEVNFRSMGVHHVRNIEFIPGSQLTCMDEVRCDRNREIKQWFHFDSRWHLISNESLSYTLSDGVRSITISCEGAEESRCYFGQSEPAMQGWRMRNGVLRSAYSICMISSGKIGRFKTKIKYGHDHSQLEQFNLAFEN